MAAPLLTSQLRAEQTTTPGQTASPAQTTATALAPAPSTQPGEPVKIEAKTQQKQGDAFTLSGDVRITYKNLTFSADEITYNEATGEATATGHVRLLGGPHDEDVHASRGHYNLQSESGTFYDVLGTTGIRLRGNRLQLTSSRPFIFAGSRVDKTGPDHFVVHDGWVTSCDNPEMPAWSFRAQRVVVEVGDNAQIYHTTFRLGRIPLFYLPYVQHPVEALGRQSGFLIPTVGQSSTKGTVLGDAFYWAINRSFDTTIGAEYFSDRGWAQHGEFRGKPSDKTYFEVRYFGVLDRGFGPTKMDQGGEDVRGSGETTFPFGIRGVADIEYLSSFVFRQAFTETFSQAVNSEVRSLAFASKAQNGYFFNLSGNRYQNFESTAKGDYVSILHIPSFEVGSVEKRIRRTPFVFSYGAAAEGVSRREPGFETDPVVGRFDLTPSIAAPLFLKGWTFRPELVLHETYYTQRVVPNGSLGTPVPIDANRRAVEIGAEARPPAISRVFDRQIFGRQWKHVVEPRLNYRLTSGVDNFSSIIRFDAKDILSNTNELEYALVNRIYARRPNPGDCSAGGPAQPVRDPMAQNSEAPEFAHTHENLPAGNPCYEAGSAREIVTWELAQKAFFDPDFGGAVVNGRRNVLTTTAEFSGIAFLTEPRHTSPLASRLRIHPSASTDLQWTLDYDFKKGRINASTAIAAWRFGEFFVGGSHAYFHVPGEIFTTNPIPGPDLFNQFRVLAGWGHPNKRGFNFAGNIGADTNLNFLQYSVGQLSYNWDCIGATFEYRRLALGAVRNENQFRFSLSLANIGTFGTMRRQERLF
ncbi:MAG TPA: LPS assembly protein LptD [Terriglobales bacterium]|nr:LPS assembly protein LptD [Terriglobales bacterium]